MLESLEFLNLVCHGSLESPNASTRHATLSSSLDKSGVG
jgi:hypothetical protein